LRPKFCIAVDGGGVLPLNFRADITVRLARPSQPALSPEQERALLVTLPRGGGGAGKRGSHAFEPVGFHPYAGASRGAFGVGVPFGQTDCGTLTALASLAECWSDGLLRVTPWRVLMLGAVRRADATRLADVAAALNLISDPRDPRLRAFACIGSNGCSSGTVPARADAARLAAAGFEGTLHVSGCAKGCAHPGAATITMVGDAGRYRIVRDDRANVA
jgi:precorrin-3B synthase